MGSFLVSTHGGLNHWQGLLLVVSLLNYWYMPTTAELGIWSTDAAKGEHVRLRLRHKPSNVKGFMWFKGEGEDSKYKIASYQVSNLQVKGPAHSGRERILYDGSLLISGVTQEDAGMYTVIAFSQGAIRETGFGRLNVYEPVSVPTLIASNTTVTEKDAVVLTCYTNANYTEWLFFGKYMHLRKRMKLSEDHRTLTINPVRRKDAGYYQCLVFNPISVAESLPLYLQVNCE